MILVSRNNRGSPLTLNLVADTYLAVKSIFSTYTCDGALPPNVGATSRLCVAYHGAVEDELEFSPKNCVIGYQRNG